MLLFYLIPFDVTVASLMPHCSVFCVSILSQLLLLLPESTILTIRIILINIIVVLFFITLPSSSIPRVLLCCYHHRRRASLSICSCYFDGFTVDLWAYCSTLPLVHLETLASPDPILATARGDIAALDLTIIIIVVVVPVLLIMLRYYFLYKYNSTNKH